MKFIVENIPNFKEISKLTLLYRGSTHGWMRKDFHDRVDNKGSTVSIVLSSKGRLSCGYTSISWKSSGSEW